MQFDILHDPWIDVVDKDNKHVTVGVLELFENAHNYKCIKNKDKKN